MSLLHVDSVVKEFSGRSILSDVYLSGRKGEIVGLLGRNGCGKSTLLKIIFGSMAAQNEYVRVDETVLRGISQKSRFLSYLPQERFLPGHLRIGELIRLATGKNRHVFLGRNEWLLPRQSERASALSSGERRILEIMLTVHSDRDFALLDEPFNGVDPLRKEEIKDMLREQSENKGIIISDHDYRNVLDVATRIILLHGGATREIVDKEELTQWGYLPETA